MNEIYESYLYNRSLNILKYFIIISKNKLDTLELVMYKKTINLYTYHR